MAPFDFAPLTLRYAQDERLGKGLPQLSKELPQLSKELPQLSKELPQLSKELPQLSKGLPRLSKAHPPFVLSVAERQRSEVEGRKLNIREFQEGTGDG